MTGQTCAGERTPHLPPGGGGRGLTARFWSNVNPYGTFRLDVDK